MATKRGRYTMVAALSIESILRGTCLRFRKQRLAKPGLNQPMIDILRRAIHIQNVRFVVVLVAMCVFPIQKVIDAARSKREIDISHACASVVLPVQYALAFVYYQLDHIGLFYSARRTASSQNGGATQTTDASEPEESEPEMSRDEKTPTSTATRTSKRVTMPTLEVDPAGGAVSRFLVLMASRVARRKMPPKPGPQAFVETKADVMLNSRYLTRTPVQMMCACVYVVTTIDICAKFLNLFLLKIDPIPRWMIPFWIMTHTVGTFVFVLNVCVFVFVIMRHVNVVSVYCKILENQKWSRASEWRASTMLLNVIHMKYSISVSASVLSNIFSSATLLHTVMIVSLYYSDDKDKYTIENLWNVIFFASTQAAFALSMYRLSSETAAITEVVHSPAFANRYLRRRQNATREQAVQDSSRTSDWSIIRKVLAEPWIEFCVLGFPVQDFSFLKKVAAVTITLVTFLNSQK